LTLKNVADDLLERLRRLAAAERRSVDQEALHLLERALAPSADDPKSSGSPQGRAARGLEGDRP
jgi:plasmid stability protein